MNDSDKTKEQLIQENELLRTLIDSLPDRLYVKDEKGRFIICNKAVAEDTDLPFSGNPIGKSDFDLFDTELAGNFYAAEQQIIKTGNPIVNEEIFRVRRKNGQSSWALCTKLPWRDKNGKIIGILGANRDITERKLAELALYESETRYKAIFETAREGILVADIETKHFKYANPAICRMFGYSVEEMTSLAVPDIHPKEHLQYILAAFKAHTKDQELTSQNIPCLRKDGTVFYVDISTTNVVIDQKHCNVGFFTDTTERKHAEEALRESEEKYRGLAERSSDAIFIVDKNGFLTYVSPACENIFGYKPEEVLGKHFENYVADSEIPKVVKKFTEKLRGKRLDVLDFESRKKNGSQIFIEVGASLVMQNGKVAGVQGIVKDITERKKAEEQLKKAHEGLETRVKQRTADLAKAVEKLQKEIAERKHAEASLCEAEVRFRSIFENTIVGLYRTTPGGRVLLANPALIKMMGCRSFKELAAFNVEKNGYDPSTPRSIFKKLMKKHGRVIGLESVWRRPDGKKLFVSESAFAVKNAKGKILYYEGTAHDVTERKEAEAKLMLYQQQLRSLASELSLAEERLRRRIAAELHDHIAQNLAISKIKLESLADNADPGLVKSLNEVNGLISQTIGATRSLTFEVSPPVLYELGFEAAVNWLAKQTRQQFGLEVEFANDGKPKPLNPDIRVLLFQAVRESLVNVVKHAKAQKAKIFICRIKKNIQVTVEDNGVGFDAEAISTAKDPVKGGFGLFNIRERLDQIGGSVIINARAGKGTRITLTAPIEMQEKPHTSISGARSEKNSKQRKKKERLA